MLIFTLFFIDIFSATLLNKYLIQSLFCLLIANTIESTKLLQTYLILFLLSLESFLFYGRFGFDLGILLILLIITKKIRILFATPYLTGILMLLLYVGLKIFFLENLILNINSSLYKLFLQLIINLPIMMTILIFQPKKRTLLGYN